VTTSTAHDGHATGTGSKGTNGHATLVERLGGATRVSTTGGPAGDSRSSTHAAQLVAYRVEHGLSQSALGRRLSMHQPAIARLEAGEHNPSFETLARLSTGLGISFKIEITPQGVAV